eukprot:3066577-Prymnesium_polylepis.1
MEALFRPSEMEEANTTPRSLVDHREIHATVVSHRAGRHWIHRNTDGPNAKAAARAQLFGVRVARGGDGASTWRTRICLSDAWSTVKRARRREKKFVVGAKIGAHQHANFGSNSAMSVELVIARAALPPITLHAPTTCTVAQLKSSLHLLNHLPEAQRPPPAEQQHLLFSGQLLTDDCV